MIPRNEGLEMVKLLLEKTRKDQILWSCNEEGEFVVNFDHFSFLVARKQENGSAAYSFSVVSEKNPLGTMDIRGADNKAAFDLLQSLYDEAAQKTILGLLKEAKDSLERHGQVFRAPQAATTTTPPPLPKPPSSEQVERILAKVAGEWKLDYSRGTEQVIIESSGNYYIRPNEPSKQKPPNFRLAIIACNPDLTAVEWRKDKPNGESLQIEVLRMGEKRIEGFAKHDQHELVYARTK